MDKLIIEKETIGKCCERQSSWKLNGHGGQGRGSIHSLNKLLHGFSYHIHVFMIASANFDIPKTQARDMESLSIHLINESEKEFVAIN